jgi:hypothetical protein
VCLATYNSRNDQHYDELIARAAQIEREYLNLPHGAFTSRPQTWLKFGKKRRWVVGKRQWALEIRPVAVEHRWPIGLIYAATCALWMGLFVRGAIGSSASPMVTTEVEVAAVLMVLLMWVRLRAAEKGRRKRLRRQVIRLMADIGTWKDGGNGFICSKLSRAIAYREILFGIGQTEAVARVRHQLQKRYDLGDPRDRSLLLGAVIDLPARWIEDVSTGRR